MADGCSEGQDGDPSGSKHRKTAKPDVQAKVIDPGDMPQDQPIETHTPTQATSQTQRKETYNKTETL